MLDIQQVTKVRAISKKINLSRIKKMQKSLVLKWERGIIFNMNFDEMTNSDLICVAHEIAHPKNEPSAENADLIDELVRRIRQLEKAFL